MPHKISSEKGILGGTLLFYSHFDTLCDPWILNSGPTNFIRSAVRVRYRSYIQGFVFSKTNSELLIG